MEYQNALEAAKQVFEAPKIADEILTRVVIESIKKYQQKLSVGLEDSITDLLDNFKHKITSLLLSQNIQAGSYQPALFPKNCRFFCSKLNHHFVVIEEPPQVRRLRFHKSLNTASNFYSLAMPYVIFIIHLYGEYDSFKLDIAWRPLSLNSLDDKLYKAKLPNIYGHQGTLVCLGKYELTGSITEKVDDIIDYFWTSEFTDDVIQNWVDCDPELWQQKTRLDPNFILRENLEELSWKIPDYFFTIKQDEATRVLTSEIDSAINVMFNKILEYFRQHKFEKHFPKDIEKEISAAFEYASKEYTLAIMALEHASINKEQINHGPFWNPI